MRRPARRHSTLHGMFFQAGQIPRTIQSFYNDRDLSSLYVHVQVKVDVIPEITINLEATGDVQGNEIEAKVSIVYSDEE